LLATTVDRRTLGAQAHHDRGIVPSDDRPPDRLVSERQRANARLLARTPCEVTAIYAGAVHRATLLLIVSVTAVLGIGVALDLVFHVGQYPYLAALVATFAGVFLGLPFAM
jgi:hypothetical protein